MTQLHLDSYNAYELIAYKGITAKFGAFGQNAVIKSKAFKEFSLLFSNKQQAFRVIKMKLDKLDEKILNSLMDGPEKKLKKVALDVKTTLPTLYNRIDRLKKQEILKGTKPNINVEKLGYLITAVIQINVKRTMLQDVAKILSNKAGITSLFEVSGQYNLTGIVKMKSTGELKALIEELSAINEVNDIETSIAYNSFKESLVPSPLKI